jgi:hypothetical protein
MKKEDIKEILKELESDLSDRISELYEIKGMQAHRHAFIYYRDKVLEALRILEK